MDFDLDEDLEQVQKLAGKVFGDLTTQQRLREVEQADGFDRALWQALVDTDLLGIALPEEAGGAGMGVTGLMVLLEQQGRRVAPVPLWSALATAALPIAEHGSPAQRERWLTGLLDGSLILTGSFEQLADGSEPLSGSRDGSTLRVSGTLALVPGGSVADAIVVPVALDSGDHVVAILPADRGGLTVTQVRATDQLNAAAAVLDGVELSQEDLLPGADASAVEGVRARARLALCALAIGVGEEALRMTAEYTSQRHQFGRPLSTNQAVPLRAADAYLNIEAIRLTTHRAAWHLDRGEEHEGRVAAMVAKLWGSRGGLSAVHATQHLHGGLGADIDYPIHRYFLWGRQIAFTMGSAAAVQTQLGDLLEVAPAIGAST